MGVRRFFITNDGDGAQVFDWQLRLRALKWLFFGGEPVVGPGPVGQLLVHPEAVRVDHTAEHKE